MSPNNRAALAERVAKAAEAALAAQSYASPIDVLLGVGWLDPNALKRWRLGQVDRLERVVQANLAKVSEAMKLFRAWADAKGLKPSLTAYVARTPDRRKLVFSVGGDPGIERLYATHWVSPALSEKKREKLEERASRPPELVAVMALKGDWKCHRCQGSGAFLVMETPGPMCMACAGLGDLTFLPSGDAALTRRAKAASARHAVVVRYAKARGRYERQGMLVEARALAAAERELGLPPGGDGE